MNLPLQTDEKFLCDLPPWIEANLASRLVHYQATYAALGETYAKIYPDLYTVNGYTLDDVSGWMTEHCPTYGTWGSKFPTLFTTEGYPMGPAGWFPPAEPYDPDSWFLYCQSAAWGLLQGQMYAMMLIVQSLRFTKGHFGRKPNSGSNYGKNRRKKK